MIGTVDALLLSITRVIECPEPRPNRKHATNDGIEFGLLNFTRSHRLRQRPAEESTGTRHLQVESSLRRTLSRTG